MAETIFIKYYEETDCLHGYSAERTVELTRQEAIECMAKAMCQSLNHCGPCRYKNDKEKCEAAIDFHWGFEAKAALNALLEANNER